MAAQSHDPLTPDAAAVAALMLEHKIARIRYPSGYEIELHPSAFLPAPAAPELAPPEQAGIENGGEPTEEQLMYWSAPGPLPKARPDEERR